MKTILKLATLPLLLSSLPVFSATVINLEHKNISTLQAFVVPNAATTGVMLKEIKRNVDFNHTLHIRVQETYQGHPVWGGDAIVHVPKANNVNQSLMNVLTPASKMNGKLYQNLNVDLGAAPQQAQAEKALQTAIANYQHKVGGKPVIKDQQSELIVYIDDNNKAVWAYKVSFYVEPLQINGMPAKPVYVMDANTFTVYREWNDIKTLDDVTAGGFGGNEKIGKLVYDGLQGHLSALNMQRDSAAQTCYMQNEDVMVLNKSKHDTVISFPCNTTDSEHGGIYWNADMDAVNHAYSPANDALYAGAVIKNMYQNWYNVPVLIDETRHPMQLVMRVHDTDFGMSENAYWDGTQMTFGDGGSHLYPLTSLEIAAHEVSHGFTEQHSSLQYLGQSGGLNESFSDMAAKAATYYSIGTVDKWDIGSEVFKGDHAIRYMDQPSKDCKWYQMPGWDCSVDRADQVYVWWMVDVHHSSGVFNHLFYILSNSEGWNAKKAFDVMVQANMNYWTPQSTFQDAACGVMNATQDYAQQDQSYDAATVAAAFKQVALDTSKC